MPKTQAVLPDHVAMESRICFGIKWFASEEDAHVYDQYVRKMGWTYNGGFYHGCPLGRDPRFDRTVDGVKRYAVTT
jgi:hypothetical protein